MKKKKKKEKVDDTLVEQKKPSKKEKKEKLKEEKKETSPFSKKKKGAEVEEDYLKIEEDDSGNASPLSVGRRDVKDLISPSGFDLSNKEYLKVGKKFVRSFVMNGYPDVVEVGWLDSLYNASNDMDINVSIMPTDERSALDEINLEIAKQEAQLAHEMKSGNIKNLGIYEARVRQLYSQRERLEQRHEKIYHSCITATLHTDTLDELDKETYALKHTLGARKINLQDMYLRHDEGYKTNLPIGDNIIPDKNRSINTGGLIASFPFYNSEINHSNGVFLGLNMMNGTPVYLDAFDRSVLDNGNFTVLGKSGSGKTFFVSLLTARSTLKKVSTTIIDVEGEYMKICEALGGRNVILGKGETMINPFDIESEYVPELKKEVVNVKSKISDLLNMIGVMLGGMDNGQRSIASLILRQLYEDDWGINEDPRSLYTKEETYNRETGEYIYAGTRKIMPTLSDFYNKLKQYEHENNNPGIREMINSLTMFTRGNVYDMWDYHTSKELEGLKNYPVINFNISALEGDPILMSLAMFVTLSWTWESWVKKEQHKNKRIIVDECWRMLDPQVPGSEYTASFLNTAARRCRKRACGLLVASQSFHEFVNNPKGMAVLMNSSVNIFLRTESMAIDSIQQVFNMSDGERNFLMSAKKGQVLIRIGEESCATYIVPFDYEKTLIENPFAANTKVKQEEGLGYEDYDYEDYE